MYADIALCPTVKGVPYCQTKKAAACARPASSEVDDYNRSLMTSC